MTFKLHDIIIAFIIGVAFAFYIASGHIANLHNSLLDLEQQKLDQQKVDAQLNHAGREEWCKIILSED